MDKARGFAGKISLDDRLNDTQAAIDHVKSAGKVAVLGYCMGGSIAFLSATRLNGVSAGVGYYGGQIAQFHTEKPKAPIMLHFGEKDQSIPLTDVEKIKAAQLRRADLRPAWAPVTASTATSAAHSTPKRRSRSPPAAARNSSRSTSAEAFEALRSRHCEERIARRSNPVWLTHWIASLRSQ